MAWWRREDPEVVILTHGRIVIKLLHVLLKRVTVCKP